MHNGFLNIDNEKMSKSLNNFFTARDIMNEYPPEAVRLFLISAHYRSPINFSREQIQQAEATLKRLYEARDRALFLQERAVNVPADADTLQKIADAEKQFSDALDDDLNTADALSAMFELVRILNVSIEKNPTRQAAEAFLGAFSSMSGVLGLVTKAPDSVPEGVQRLLDERALSRKEKRFKDSDRLRDEIRLLGYIVEDTPQGQKAKQA